MSFINLAHKQLWYSWLPGCGSTGSQVSKKQRKREIVIYIACVLAFQVIFFASASIWLKPYSYMVYTLAKPLLNIPSYQTIQAINVTESGAKVEVDKELMISGARFPGLEPTLQQAFKDQYKPDKTFTINTMFAYEIPGRLTNLSILIALVLMLPRKRIIPKLKGIMVLSPLVVLVHVLIVFILDVAKMMYFTETTFFSRNFMTYTETFSYYNWVIIIFLWFVYGVFTRYENKRTQ